MFNKIKENIDKKLKEIEESSKVLSESSKGSEYKIHHDSYTSAVDEAIRHAKERGYKHDPIEIGDKIGLGPRKPSEGQTNSFHLNLYKDGDKAKEMHHIQIYGMGNGKYELNQYMDTPSKSKKIKEEVEQIDEVSKDVLTSYTKKSSKDLADKERNFYNPEETDVMNIVKKASKIGQRKLGIEQAQNKLAKGEYDVEKPSTVTMQAKYTPKKKSKVSDKAMKELKPDYATDNKQMREDVNEEIKVGDAVHVGMKNKGGYGNHGHVTNIEGDKLYYESPYEEISAITKKPYKKQYVGNLKFTTKMKSDFSDKLQECSTYSGDESYKDGDNSKEYATHYESFSDALEAAKEHAKSSGYKHDPEEFSTIVNKGFIKPKENKTNAFHMNLYHNDGKEVLNKIHSFQISGKGDGKFYITQDIK